MELWTSIQLRDKRCAEVLTNFTQRILLENLPHCFPMHCRAVFTSFRSDHSSVSGILRYWPLVPTTGYGRQLNYVAKCAVNVSCALVSLFCVFVHIRRVVFLRIKKKTKTLKTRYIFFISLSFTKDLEESNTNMEWTV